MSEFAPFEPRQGSRFIDMAGARIGRLAVLAPAGLDRRGLLYWSCSCDCGKPTNVSGANLRTSAVQSCGCLRVERSTAAWVKDLVGQRFGRLVVRERAGSTGRLAAWRCACDCGGEKIVAGAKLRKGGVVSCGCALKDKPGIAPPSARAIAAARSSVRRGRLAGAGGRFTAAQVADIHRRQRGCCANCGNKLGNDFHRDHRVPLARCGSNDASNIDLLCPTCNVKKGAKDPIDWANQNGRLL